MAKKKLSRDQKRKQKKQKRHSPHLSSDPNQRLLKRVRQHGFEQKVIRNPVGQVKMSQVLRQFVEPYWHIPDDEQGMRKLLTTALVAWNTALLPEAERSDHLRKMAEALPEETHADFYVTVSEMIKRKETYFAQYDRTIIDYELVDRGDDYHITVMSLMPGGEE
ncbi:MAG: hypothetical protein KDJ65_38825 [Anaerolineae bacterium]|nr:hypothetical protein [Anaerolineae bacterium]